MGYSGLVAREHSSGNRIQRGAITKTGNAHLRRVLVEAAWAYQHRPSVDRLSAAKTEVIWPSATKSNRSPGKRSTGCTSATQAISARGKNKNQIVTALGRELLGFVWAIATQVEKQQHAQAAAA